jgi:hypothetical protein
MLLRYPSDFCEQRYEEDNSHSLRLRVETRPFPEEEVQHLRDRNVLHNVMA